MKKFLSVLFLLFSFYIFSTLSIGRAESTTNANIRSENELQLEKKIVELEKDIRVKSLVQYIEFESEVIFPSNFNVNNIEYAYKLSNELQLPTRVTFRLMFRESSFVDTVTSPKGANGLMQLMPETRRSYYDMLRVDTLHLDRNEEDIYIGMNYLKDLYIFWKDRGNSDKISWKLGLASYNAGKGSVLKYRGIPPYKETIDFVNFITRSHSNPEFFANYLKKYENNSKNNT